MSANRNKNYKFTVYILAVMTTVLLGFNTSDQALALDITTENKTNEIRNSNFCNKIDTLSNVVDEKVQGQLDTLEFQKYSQKNNIQNIFKEKNEKIKKNRTVWDSNRKKQIDKLKSNYKKDNNKMAAIEKFDRQINDAIKERRTKMDKITNSYTSEMLQDFNKDTTSLENIAKNYQKLLVGAQEKAESGCKSGEKSELVRDRMRNEVLIAKKELIKGAGGLDSYKDKFTKMANNRRYEIQNIKERFQSSLREAEDQLSTALQSNN